jgi:hypothetical protein
MSRFLGVIAIVGDRQFVIPDFPERNAGIGMVKHNCSDPRADLVLLSGQIVESDANLEPVGDAGAIDERMFVGFSEAVAAPLFPVFFIVINQTLSNRTLKGLIEVG